MPCAGSSSSRARPSTVSLTVSIDIVPIAVHTCGSLAIWYASTTSARAELTSSTIASASACTSAARASSARVSRRLGAVITPADTAAGLQRPAGSRPLQHRGVPHRHALERTDTPAVAPGTPLRTAPTYIKNEVAYLMHNGCCQPAAAGRFRVPHGRRLLLEWTYGSSPARLGRGDRQLSERTDIGRVAYRPSPAGGVGGDQFPDQKGGASSPINASTTPPFALLRLWTTTLPVLPLGSSNVKVFPSAFLGPLPALLAGRKSPAHGGVPPLRAGSAKSAAVPGVRVPSEARSTEALR